MLILTIKTDESEAQTALYEDDKSLKEIKWRAHRDLAKTIHLQIAKILQSVKADWNDLDGIVIFKGPGSFTGLRIGITVANALADGLNIAAVGTKNQGWQQAGIKKLLTGKNHKIVLPDYGSPAKTTNPKK